MPKGGHLPQKGLAHEATGSLKGTWASVTEEKGQVEGGIGGVGVLEFLASENLRFACRAFQSDAFGADW